MKTTRLRGLCPGCGGELVVSHLECPACELHITGHFEQCEFCRLTREEVEFVRIFLACRGVLRDVERELGVSYPTVRGMLDSVLKRLDLQDRSTEPAAAPGTTNAAAPAAAANRREVLDRLERKEIGVDEAVRRLKETP